MSRIPPRIQSPGGRSITAWLVLALIVVTCGCGGMRRRMTIRTNPPGARVYIDDHEEEVGTTPFSRNFTYYGERKIRIVKDGYETATFLQSVPAPWYQIPIIDFVADNLVPWEIRDTRDFCYQLTPQRVVPPEELLQRGEQLRYETQPAACLTPASAPGVAPPVTPAPMTPAPAMEPIPTPPPTSGLQPVPQPQLNLPPPPGQSPGNYGGQPVHPLPPSGLR